MSPARSRRRARLNKRHITIPLAAIHHQVKDRDGRVRRLHHSELWVLGTYLSEDISEPGRRRRVRGPDGQHYAHISNGEIGRVLKYTPETVSRACGVLCDNGLMNSWLMVEFRHNADPRRCASLRSLTPAALERASRHLQVGGQVYVVGLVFVYVCAHRKHHTASRRRL